MNLRVLSYNIHKGFDARNRDFVLDRMKSSIEEAHADVVLLQEVVGHHERHRSRIKAWPKNSQFEHLADRLWPHFAYGKNAVYKEGHHGNAILSKYPITFWENEDVSQNSLERRGLLHAAIQVPDTMAPIHLICVHLGLLERHRAIQVDRICRRVAVMVPSGAPMILGGDFNDWRGKATPQLEERLGLREVFRETRGQHAKTFPSWYPLLRLDRLYYRGFQLASAELVKGNLWSGLSDHLPIVAELRKSE